MQAFFSPEEEENFVYPDAFAVDFDRAAEFDAGRDGRRARSTARSAS